MDPIFIVGLLVTIIAIVVSTIMDGNSLGVLIGPSSLLLVSVGTVGAAVMAYRTSELGMMPKSVVKAIKADVPDVQVTITQLAKLAEVARRDGMLALETRLEEVDDRFVRLGLQLLVDVAD